MGPDSARGGPEGELGDRRDQKGPRGYRVRVRVDQRGPWNCAGAGVPEGMGRQGARPF